ncbi:MAG: hypothetical protein DSY90_00920 [Deltaproteobacteria bacterium]|nr:MAG: hypothetical protein DSY90_00920 [Deltaproteobacteria bacterium]
MRSLTWKMKLMLLAVAAVPAFTGYPLMFLNDPVIAGITRGWLGYSLGVHGILAMVLGPAVWGICLSIAVLIMLPVVFGGAAISYLLYLSGLGTTGPAGYSAHYLGLCITMLTVIPLANGLISVIPVHRIERTLLTRETGVSFIEKAALMFIRVFTHIVFFVIPNVLEIVREERQQRESLPLRHQAAGAIRMLVYLGVEGICASVRYIPLWAEEIAALPDRRSKIKAS